VTDCGKVEQNQYLHALQLALQQVKVKRVDIEFTTEGEACLNGYACERERHLVAGKEHLLIDAGGGTFDL
jgi:hypothetical protein